MSRFPPIPPNNLTDEQRITYKQTTETCKTLFGTDAPLKDANGAFEGPFAPLLYTPPLMQPHIQIAVELSKITELPPAARETAILATCGAFQAAYEVREHEKLAVYMGFLSGKQVECITNGEKPEDERLSEECEVAFDTAIELTQKRRPLSTEMFERAVGTFGRRGTLALIHYVGLYSYTSILLNGADVPCKG